MDFIFLRPGMLLATLALLAGSGRTTSAQSAAPQTFTREAMLRDIAVKIIAPGCENLAAKCRDLTNAIGQLAKAPDQISLEQARQAWRAVASAANQQRCFQAGPMTDRDCATTFYCPRVSPPGIERVLQSSNLLTQAFLAQIGSGVKGVFALEYLLFGQNGFPGMATSGPSVLELLSAKDSSRRRTYMLALACDLEAKASQLAQDLASPGDQGASAKFVAGGSKSVDVLVNQLAHALEDAQQAQLHFVLVLPRPLSGQLYRIEASPSGTSLRGVVDYLEGTQRFYLGAGGLGLADALKPVNAPLAKRIEESFAAAIAATKAIGEPLDQAVMDRPEAIQNACDKVHALEILFKVDLASALGVTIFFTSGDGD
jgi:predicted lipoprotein